MMKARLLVDDPSARKSSEPFTPWRRRRAPDRAEQLLRLLGRRRSAAAIRALQGEGREAVVGLDRVERCSTVDACNAMHRGFAGPPKRSARSFRADRGGGEIAFS
jgi:hypothetical protein